ncbi:hypothetical protein [Armatimonas sp.]|uniref:hypothetical protein n=1 Tax=Armatimonas sp. TaxID=1872638 RepID=UPI00286B4A46|nr:hypothetical protein [Armatimonas sp.]
MKNRVPCNDESLLLLLHGELSLGAVLRLRLHLWGCPTCRERAQTYARLSAGLATALSHTGQAPRIGTRSPFLLSPLWLIPGLMVIILGSIGAVALQWRTANPYFNLPQAASSQIMECEAPATPCPKR